MRNYFVFLRRCAAIAFAGDWRYYAWMGLLTVLCLLGLNAYCRQFARGLIVTGIVWACAVGLLGGFFPALRAARLPAGQAIDPKQLFTRRE